ncbi:hypothetical protein ABPG72_008863 [Tetrahymena utriculariae]
MDNCYAEQGAQQQDSQLQIYSQQSLRDFNLFYENNNQNFQGFSKSQQKLSSTEDQHKTFFQDTSYSGFKNNKKRPQNYLNRKRAYLDYENEEKQQNSSEISAQKNCQFTNQQGSKQILTFFPSNVNNIEYLLKIQYSYGNKDLLETIQKLQTIWDNVQRTKILILNQYQDRLFQQHCESRKAASILKFKQLTEGLNQKSLIFYIRLSVNYEKQLYESDRVGYSPELYDIIAENSYAFKEYLKASGYFDPHNTYFKLKQCINTTLHFLANSASALFSEQGYSSQKIETKRIDKFTFPVEARARFFNLDHDYDSQHSLNFKNNGMLVTYENIFEDPNIHSKFKMYRQIQQSVQSNAITQQNDEEIDDRPEYQELKLFKKYYQDDGDKLIEIGNKWFKKCGLINLPQKKSKKANN